MGLEAAYVPYIVAAAGAYGGALNQAHAARKKDTQLAAGIQEQGVHQQEAANEVNALVQKRAQSNTAGAKNAGAQELMDTLRRNKAAGAVQGVTGANSRYDSMVDQGNASVGDYGSQLGNSIASVDAATRQREAEQTDSTQAVSRLQQIQRRASGDNSVNMLKVNSITANPYIDLASKLGVNLGAAGAMNGGFGGKAFGGKVPKGAGMNLTPTSYATDPFSAGATSAFA